MVQKVRKVWGLRGASTEPPFQHAAAATTVKLPTALMPPGKRAVNSHSKQGKKPHKQHLRKKFESRHIDQVWEDIRKPPTEVHVPGKAGPLGTTGKAELDEDVPGFGRHYCLACSKYFQTAVALADHDATKPHKRRVKLLMNTPRPHNQRDAEAAGGMGAPDNGPKLRSGDAMAM